MTLRRLLDMVREKFTGAPHWQVAFTVFRQGADSSWPDVDPEDAITSIQVEGDEVLLIRDSSRPPLTVAVLVDEMSSLVDQHGDLAVDSCEPPTFVDDEVGCVHFDFPIMGIGKDEQNERLLLLHVVKSDVT
jgi:hypothetical protein